MKALAVFLMCLGAAAQEPPAPAETPKPGTVSGIVTVAGTGTPMKNVQVIVGRGGPQERTATTDAQGRYTLREVAPGMQRILAMAPDASGRPGFGPSATRQIVLAPGQDSTVDLQVILPGRITGKVVDQNKEPVPGITVFLVAREYTYGALRAYFTSAATTDDEGVYTLERVTPGRTYAVMANRLRRNLKPISDAPLDPAVRLPSVVPTYFPNAPSLDGSEPLILRPGERREGVDIRIRRAASFCLEGVLEGNSGPGALNFDISETQPTSGQTGSGGFYMSPPGGKTGPDGKFRLCDLHPGDYELSVSEYRPGGYGAGQFNAAVVTIGDRDVSGVRLGLRPRIPVAGEVAFDGPPPATPIDTKLGIAVIAVTRAERGNAQAAIPGAFTFDDGLLMDEYGTTFNAVPPGTYVKDVTYGDRSILNRTLRVGSAIGNASLRVVLARDGGSIAARVADKDGNPVADCTVVILPATAASEAEFAALMKTGQSDASGRWSGPQLAPGKYVVLATQDAINRSPEVIAKLWAARTRGEEVEVVAGGKPAVTLMSRSLD
ncbi:MAG: carboxypeptidase regulatory-like domain-containing protein [Candidatus Solibacter sp.]